MRQYFEIKDQYPGTILLFRVGDFYETFADDAERVSRELGITLTKRNNGGDMTPLAGFPYHALETYLPKLVKKGYRVAICEQTEDPESAKKAGKKVVSREVTEITTPGVILSENLLDHNRNNYIVALHRDRDVWGVAFCDISTGEFALSQVEESELGPLMQSLAPSELLAAKSQKKKFNEELLSYNITEIEEWVFEGDYGYRQLTEQLETHSLKGFGVEELSAAHVAGGALLHYMQQAQKSSLGHIRSLYAYVNHDYMELDSSTRRNLELTRNIHEEGADGTLVSILDHTRTAMGGRLLRKWITRPLKQLESIRNRLGAVSDLVNERDTREELRRVLKEVGDLERLISRISVGRTNARDLKQLELSLARIPELSQVIAEVKADRIQEIAEKLDPPDELRERIAWALVDEPPATLHDGGIFQDGFSEELDQFRSIARDGKTYIAGIKEELSRKTGIPSLKIGYNKVFGYYIEVTNTHKEKVPEEFIRKQTLVNSERYITPELKEVEEKILTAEDRIRNLEAELFEELRVFAAGFADRIQQLAAAIAEIDCIQGFAEAAYRHNYVMPEVDDSDELVIEKGRHPVVEQTLPADEPFIPNDIRLDNSDHQILIITGPNMAGKSVILRQIGLITLMAQIGSFVPAKTARIGLVDKIFTRVGASDNLAAGESTFLVEMNEAANILNNATARSLILLDEVGRGTSTFDGLSIAWSLAEYLHNNPKVAAKTLFATHYHEMNELERLYERVKNYNVKVKEHEGKVIFMRKLVRGGADHSYGIQVADMAGLPAEVIERAKEILSNLERHSLDVTNENGENKESANQETGADSPDGVTEAGKEGTSRNLPSTDKEKGASRRAVREAGRQDPIPQMSLFQADIDPGLEQVLDKLEAVDPDRITPIDALALLNELKRLSGRS